jgi:hypothetical protein
VRPGVEERGGRAEAREEERRKQASDKRQARERERE